MEATPVFLAVDAERDGAWAAADCGCHLELVDGGAEFRQCPTHAAAPDLLAAAKLSVAVVECFVNEYHAGHASQAGRALDSLRAAIRQAE